jgi:hypothetical protein
MPTPAISPANLGATSYTVSNSKSVLADLKLFVPNTGAGPSFQVSYPAGLAGAQVALTSGGTSLNLIPPLDDSATFASRRVISTVTPQGANSVLSCEIRALAAGGVAEAWRVTVTGLGGATCTFTQQDNDPADLTITRLMCDPVAKFSVAAGTLSGSTVREKDATVTLTADDATGPAVLPTVVGGPAPQASYQWGYTPASPDDDVAITAFNGACSLSPTFVFAAPGVYGSKNLNLQLTCWFDSPCPGPGLLNNTSDPKPLTIVPRPQYLLLVLDRSGSMAGSRWDNAVTAARLLVNTFAAIRAGVGPADDQVGVIVFEDSGCTWHGPPADPLIAPVPMLALGLPGDVDGSSCAAVFGPAGTCTPIGDALVEGLTLLNKLPKGNLAKYTMVLLTDGYENSGTVKVDPNTPSPASTQPFSTARNAYPDVTPNLSLYTIGLGGTVQEDVLQTLAGEGSAVYRAIMDVSELKSGIAQMVSFSQEAMEVTPLAGLPPTGDPAPPAGPCRYFQLDPKVNRLLVAVEWTAATDTLTLDKRDGTSGNFVPITAVARQCPEHGFATLDLARVYGGVSQVPATQWRLSHLTGGVRQTIPDDKLMIFVDLNFKADVSFDRPAYRTGQPIVVTARLSEGNRPITDARVGVQLTRPGESLGTFLGTNGVEYRPGPPVFPDPPAPKQAMLRDLLRRKGWPALPTLTPAAIFADGTNQLYDDGHHDDGLAHDGVFANVFKATDKEGTYTWRFLIEARLSDGSVFTRTLTVSRWVGIQVSAPLTTVTLDRTWPRPEGLLAVQIVMRPVDANHELLGPFRASEIRYRATAGTFLPAAELSKHLADGVAFPQPDGAGTFSHYDGRYSRVLVYKEGEKPFVSIRINSTVLNPVTVA